MSKDQKDQKREKKEQTGKSYFFLCPDYLKIRFKMSAKEDMTKQAKELIWQSHLIFYSSYSFFLLRQRMLF